MYVVHGYSRSFDYNSKKSIIMASACSAQSYFRTNAGLLLIEPLRTMHQIVNIILGMYVISVSRSILFINCTEFDDIHILYLNGIVATIK